jgi:Fic family protein
MSSSLENILNRIDKYKSIIDDYRPLSQSEIKDIDAYYCIGLTYASNALEGNSLSLTETKDVLEDGLTVAGKLVSDYFEAIGHSEAYNYMLKIAREKNNEITEENILKIHRLFYYRNNFNEAGFYRKKPVIITGTEFKPPAASKVNNLMKKFIEEINRNTTEMHPLIKAAYAHLKFVEIHPFIDGNGRVARLLMNLILMNYGYQIVVIPPVIRTDYINAIKQTQSKSYSTNESFYNLIADCELSSQKEYSNYFNIKLPNLLRD